MLVDKTPAKFFMGKNPLKWFPLKSRSDILSKDFPGEHIFCRTC